MTTRKQPPRDFGLGLGTRISIRLPLSYEFLLKRKVATLGSSNAHVIREFITAGLIAERNAGITYSGRYRATRPYAQEGLGAYITVRVPEEYEWQLRRKAAGTGRTVVQVIREFVTSGLDAETARRKAQRNYSGQRAAAC